MDKGPEAFRTISEVAEDLDLPQHVLRFWETRFAQIKPLKRGGGRRYYRPDDIELLRGIRRLLYGEGYTIKGVQRILRDQGLRHVAALGRATVIEAEVAAAGGEPRLPEPPAAGGPELYAPPAERALAGMPFAAREEMSARDYAPPAVREAAPEAEPEEAEEPDVEEKAAVPEVRPPVREDEREFGPVPESLRAPELPPVVAVPAPVPVPPVIAAPPPERPPERPAPTLLGVPPEPPPPQSRPALPTRPPLPRRDPEITAEGLRRLRATLFELTECKRMLEEARQA